MAIWNVSSLDQLAWFARRHGYATLLKLPCRSRLGADAAHNSMDPRWAAYYHPLASTSSPFVPTGYAVAPSEWLNIHDVMLVDEAATVPTGAPPTTTRTRTHAEGKGEALVAFLQRRARAECRR